MTLPPILLCSAAFLGSISLSPAAASKPLNVLLIAVDDLRPELGCYGRAIVQTPHIDRLAQKGVRFERAYCQLPLCNPSRTSLLTGRYPSTTAVMDNTKSFREQHPDWRTLPQLFRENKYFTARSGKIFHGGLDDTASWTEGAQKPGSTPPRPTTEERRKRSDRWQALEGEETAVTDYKSASGAIALLEEHHREPFFIALGFLKPHSPLMAPKKYFDLYRTTQIELPIDFASLPKSPPGAPDLAISKNGDLFIDREASTQEAKEMIRAYYACVSFVDAQVGRVLEAMDRLKLWETTILVFWGDHGYHLGEKGKWSKHGSLYEVGTRVPLIVYAPGLKGNGQSCQRPVELIDLYPTLSDLCGLASDKGVEGNSLVTLLSNPKGKWEHPAFSMTPRGRSVRTAQWRFTEWTGEKGGAELYDETKDPHELKNLAQDAASAKTVASMKRLLNSQWPTTVVED